MVIYTALYSVTSNRHWSSSPFWSLSTWYVMLF